MNALKSVRSEFKSRAVVDWIELGVTLKNGTQFRYIQDKLQSILDLKSRPYVKPVNAGPGKVATCFRLRLHDAHTATFRDLERIMTALSLVHPFADTPTVTGIEVALDFYSRNDPNAVQELVLRLQRGLQAYGNPRQFDPDKAAAPKHGNRYLNRERPEPVTGLILDPRLNLRIGDIGDAVQWQVYDKLTDNNGQPVESSQRRARAEFTLTGEELARRILGANCGSRLANLDDLRTFKFETLAELLHFRLFKPTEAVASAPILESTLTEIAKWQAHGVTNYPLGLVGTYRDKRRASAVGRRVKRKRSSHTVADAELNDIARRALKAFTRRFA
jgi:hypothetical protein